MRALTRKELTAALAERQLLRERARLDPAEAIRVLTPLQAQDPPAPYVALAARLDGFERAELEAAIDARSIVKTTIMRLTLHLVAAADYPGLPPPRRRPRGCASWRNAVRATSTSSRWSRELGRWLAKPRTNAEIREHVWRRYDGVPRHGLGAAHLRPHRAAARAAPARRPLEGPAARELRGRSAPAAERGRRRRARARALPGRLRARVAERHRELGRRRAARLQGRARSGSRP